MIRLMREVKFGDNTYVFKFQNLQVKPTLLKATYYTNSEIL